MTDSTLTCILVSLSAGLLILPILNIPSHTAPRADGITGELGTETVTILEEIDLILHSILLNKFAKFAIRIVASRLIECTARGIDCFIGFGIHPTEVIAAIGIIRVGDVGGKI